MLDKNKKIRPKFWIKMSPFLGGRGVQFSSVFGLDLSKGVFNKYSKEVKYHLCT